MKHIVALLLLALADKEVNEENINKVLNSVGMQSDPDSVESLVESCKGKESEKLIRKGIKKLNAIPLCELSDSEEEKPIETKKKKPKQPSKIREIEEAGNRLRKIKNNYDEEDFDENDFMDLF